MGINAQTRDIILDNLSGSQEITGKTAAVICQLVRGKPYLAPRELRRVIRETAGTIIQAQPAMASLYHLFARILAQLDQASSGTQATVGIRQACRSFVRDMEEHNQRISEQLFKLIKRNDTVVTHSASRSVREALLYCWARRKRFSVICDESRPVY